MSRRSALFGALSFLDLICCSLGAAVLMLIIAVTADPAGRPHAPRPPLIVMCRFAGGTRAEVGIEFRVPNHPSWQRCRSSMARDSDRRPDSAAEMSTALHASTATMFSATSEPNSGSYAVLIITDPEPGPWQFRPYLIDFPRGASTDEPVVVQLEALSRSLDGPSKGILETLHFPGEAGRPFAVP